jgi:hypothetical protein
MLSASMSAPTASYTRARSGRAARSARARPAWNRAAASTAAVRSPGLLTSLHRTTRLLRQNHYGPTPNDLYVSDQWHSLAIMEYRSSPTSMLAITGQFTQCNRLPWADPRRFGAVGSRAGCSGPAQICHLWMLVGGSHCRAGWLVVPPVPRTLAAPSAGASPPCVKPGSPFLMRLLIHDGWALEEAVDARYEGITGRR